LNISLSRLLVRGHLPHLVRRDTQPFGRFVNRIKHLRHEVAPDAAASRGSREESMPDAPIIRPLNCRNKQSRYAAGERFATTVRLRSLRPPASDPRDAVHQHTSVRLVQDNEAHHALQRSTGTADGATGVVGGSTV
jgi:hypothetical protein